MKMTVLLAPLLALCLSGCWTDPGTLAASTIPITNDDSYTVLAKEVTGTDYGFLLLTFPLWTASTYDAIQDAKEFAGADGLINVTAENHNCCLFLFTIQQRAVTGDAIKFKMLGKSLNY